MFKFQNGLANGEIICDRGDCQNRNRYGGSFPDCIKQAKEEGWFVFWENYKFYHWCPECAKLYSLDNTENKE